jgi:myo-inositol 2-dehydrogenase / D-chiro-inositol 1-dehydrogenase
LEHESTGLAHVGSQVVVEDRGEVTVPEQGDVVLVEIVGEERADGAPGVAECVERRTGAPVQVGFPRRFEPAFLRVRHDVESGILGRLTTVRSTTLDPAPPTSAYVAASGGIFRDCAIHDLDTVRWVTGREVVEVYATGSNGGDPLFREADDVDTAWILLTFDDGTLGVISNTRYNGRGYDARLEVHGSLDSVAAGLDESLPLRSADPDVAFPCRPPHTFFKDRFAAAFRAELTAFIDVVAGAPTPCTLRDGLEASWLAEVCTLSWREHRPVKLGEIR